mgnify:CR=1 FL=1
MRRYAIYFFYDKDGIVDDYNIYMLNDIKKNVDHLMVVSNGKLERAGKEKFYSVSDEIYERENEGFDVWAYKKGIERAGWDTIGEYDELILFNFTNFGPVYPFSEMFAETDTYEVDFWGITEHYGHDFDPYNKCKYKVIPRHIQSSFIAIRKSMLISKDFREYWENMPMIHDYAESICYHEAIFTEDFNRKGYRSRVYVKTEDLKEFSDYPLMLYPVELIKNRKCPIFKRKTFFNQYEEFLDISCGQSGLELYEYLRDYTDYDLNLIWDNLLRTANMYDMKQRMQLNYIISTEAKTGRVETKQRVALFMHIYSLELAVICKHYAEYMPSYADICITTDTEEKVTQLKQIFGTFKPNRVHIVKVINRGRDVGALLIGLKDYINRYDYICFMHDKKSDHNIPKMVGESFAYHCYQNTLANEIFAENVIDLFEKNPRLGLLVPPTPCHGPYYSIIGMEWQGDYQNVKELANRWGITVDINESKPAVAPLGTTFWFRKEALRKLYEVGLTYGDFPEEPTGSNDGNIMHAIERLYPFVAQQSGYYSAWGLSDKYSKMEITNLYKMFRDINQTMFWNYGVDDRHTMMHKISMTKQQLDRKNAPSRFLKSIVRKIIGNSLYERMWNMKEKAMGR